MTLRIVAGRLGGRRLKAPRGSSTRPTSERARQALFDVLGDVSRLRVLDLYAGTGALGIEALSRGAARAVFVESSRAALAHLRRNLEELALEEQARVIGTRAELSGAELGSEAFDLVFLDPPWQKLESAVRTLGACLRPGSLRAGARIVVEHPARLSTVSLPPALGLVLDDRRVWGDTAMSIFVIRQKVADGREANEASARGTGER